MAFDEDTAARIRGVLAMRRDVVEKRMFGGLCFMVNGSMCCGLTSETMMVRVGRDAHADALAQPHARPMTFTGKPSKGMVYVDPPGYSSEAALRAWIARGLAFVAGAAAVARTRAAVARTRAADGKRTPRPPRTVPARPKAKPRPKPRKPRRRR